MLNQALKLSNLTSNSAEYLIGPTLKKNIERERTYCLSDRLFRSLILLLTVKIVLTGDKTLSLGCFLTIILTGVTQKKTFC